MNQQTIKVNWNEIHSEDDLPEHYGEYLVKYEEEVEEDIFLIKITMASFEGNQHDGRYFRSLDGCMGYDGYGGCMSRKVIAWAKKPKAKVREG